MANNSYKQRRAAFRLEDNMTANIFDYRGKRAHFIGIGGSSMSGLAGYLQQTGYTVTHTGYYPKWHMTVTDIPEYGFTTTQVSQPAEKIQVPYSWIIAAKAGVAIPLKTGWSVLAGVNADYGITGDQPLSVNLELGVRCMFGLPKLHHCNCYQD